MDTLTGTANPLIHAQLELPCIGLPCFELPEQNATQPQARKSLEHGDSLLSIASLLSNVMIVSKLRIQVHKQGIALGRSVDLMKFNGYEELVAELDDMFDFNGELKSSNNEWMVVYTDHEGDMMLVGDDPWNEFCSIVYKIFIYTREEVQQMNPGALNLRSEDSPANSMERGSAVREVRGCLSTSALNSENC